MFDFNGTLVSDLDIVYSAMAAVFKTHKVRPPPLELFRNTPQVPIEWYYEQGLPRKISEMEIQCIFSLHAINCWRESRPRLRRSALQLIKECRRRRMKTAIVSALNLKLMDERADQLALRGHFDEIRGGAGDKFEAFQEMLIRFKTPPEKAFYIGDTAGDVESSRRAKITSIAFTNGYNTPDVLLAAKPDFVVKSLSEVLKIITGRRLK
ncbi:MAG: HAD family hydrolase [bacterium]|nr:HAD family hydrolase [bacterium]